MLTCITEYGETATANLTETGLTLIGAITEAGELVFSGYVEPTLQQVTDFVDFSEEGILRNKPLFVVMDSLDALDVMLSGKLLRPLVEGVALADSIFLPACLLAAADAIGVCDEAFVLKSLVIDDDMALFEATELRDGSHKTRLFLVLGDLAIELTGK